MRFEGIPNLNLQENRTRNPDLRQIQSQQFQQFLLPVNRFRIFHGRLLKVRPSLRVLFTSGYTENAIIHHGRLDEGVLLLAKPYRKSDMAIMIRKALAD